MKGLMWGRCVIFYLPTSTHTTHKLVQGYQGAWKGTARRDRQGSGDRTHSPGGLTCQFCLRQTQTAKRPGQRSRCQGLSPTLSLQTYQRHPQRTRHCGQRYRHPDYSRNGGTRFPQHQAARSSARRLASSFTRPSRPLVASDCRLCTFTARSRPNGSVTSN
jgi:hypothetical protein